MYWNVECSIFMPWSILMFFTVIVTMVSVEHEVPSFQILVLNLIYFMYYFSLNVLLQIYDYSEDASIVQ